MRGENDEPCSIDDGIPFLGLGTFGSGWHRQTWLASLGHPPMLFEKAVALLVANCWETLESADTTLPIRSDWVGAPWSTSMASAELDECLFFSRRDDRDARDVLLRTSSPSFPMTTSC